MPPTLTRRHLLVAGAAGVTAAALPLGTGPDAAVADEGARDPALVTTPARITTLAEGGVEVEPLDAGEPAPWTGPLPLQGFPSGVEVRVGDHGSVVDDGTGPAVSPLCSWVEGVPAAAGNGGYTVGDRATVAATLLPAEEAEALAAATSHGLSVGVCLVDTDLVEGLVLDVRSPTTATATSP